MSNYKTPGVYVEEISKFPPSVAGVATAIPVFIGFTEKNPNGENVPVKVKSLVDYEEKFGKGNNLTVSNGKVSGHEFCMYDSMRLFYDNGGGVCYVVSVGTYTATSITADIYKDALKPLEKVDEVTLVVCPDAAPLLNFKDTSSDKKNAAAQLGALHQAVLKHCADMGDRFAILDPIQNTNLDAAMETFRNNVGSNNLSYGAAYYPYVKTTYTKEVSFAEMLKVSDIKTEIEKNDLFNDYKKTVLELVKADVEGHSNLRTVFEGDDFKENENKLTYNNTEILKEDENGNVTLANEFVVKSDLLEAVKNAKKAYDEADATEKNAKKTALKKAQDDVQNVEDAYAAILNVVASKKLMAKAIAAQIAKYDEKLKDFQDKASVIPVSAAIAGVYSTVDANKGVWQAPANISISAVSGVTEQLSDKDQENMNVDTTAGKSVNAIRFFNGKGILVWGARTLDGNSNEWRYIPVRRLFNYVEESVQKSTAWAVFQPNDANTWMKVQSQIENFLSNLWREGALAGSTPDKAFYVKVGLDVTMTADDINNGYMIIEIGMAAVRPAEFVVLQFSHKLQEA